jgi:glucose/arabinose dehydrogenase/cytochrome c551/c552/type 1 glutamine amidotransferase
METIFRRIPLYFLQKIYLLWVTKTLKLTNSQMMHFLYFLKTPFAILSLLAMGQFSFIPQKEPPKVLIFSKTAGFVHESIPDGIAAIKKLGISNGFAVDVTNDAAKIKEENLSQYAAVIWLSTTGDVLNHYQEADFERYIQAGGGYVGIHAAADTEYEWGWYNRLVGGQFLDHPGINDPHPNVQKGIINLNNFSHSSTLGLPDIWERTDEWYSFKKLYPHLNILMDLDESSYQGGFKMGKHPIAWYHDFDGGRSFYTAGGHTRESFSEEKFLKHLLGGIQYAIGDQKPLNYNLAKTKRVPEDNRFEKKILVNGGFTEPTEMTILPNFDILITQRRGEILLYKNGSDQTRELVTLDVYWKTEAPGVNAEEGLMGIQKDPDFSRNGYIYVFYAPAGEKAVNRLSRFTFKNDRWDMSSEKIILEVNSQRNICCHTGGSIAFDKNGLLYLSTGDNSTPFNQPGEKLVLRGFAPLDDRPGFEQYDARRASGNSNDLRGKILRIKVNDDGTYDIPEGNLYPVGTPKTRPEIYIQGNRNPYRIAIDQKNGYLYWGEVGPDSNVDSLKTRGPRGYDEVNQARKAGNFGWPYFVGNNYAYSEYNFNTGETGITFEPKAPVNNSRNNTGIKELPPAQPAFLWYPYDASPDFPSLGTGGRNAMAGPVYYSDLYPEATRYPSYYDGKFFPYEWIRGWIKAVTMLPNGDFDKMEPFMGSTKFNALIDLELGPDGRFYALEYGNGWFSKNMDAALSRIDYNSGNRSPVVEDIKVNRTSGVLPFTATFTARAHDPENDMLTYVWDLGNGQTITTKEPSLTHTFKEIGDYDVQVKVHDPGNLSAKSNLISVYAGNIAPEVKIDITSNKTFYFPNKPVVYSVNISDPDDKKAAKNSSTLYVSADYVSGLDQAEASKGHLIVADAIIGKSIVNTLTCITCHKADEPSIGPSYADVAKKYRRTPNATSYLLEKIKKGGSGVWGETVMPANSDLKNDDAQKIIAYILSLGQKEAPKPSLPPNGNIPNPLLGKTYSENGMFVINASFTDRGGKEAKPLSGNGSAVLKSPKIGMDQAANLNGFSTMKFGGQTLMLFPSKDASFSLENIDLSQIVSLRLTGAGQESSKNGYSVEARLDSPDGKLIGSTLFKLAASGPKPPYFGFAEMKISPVTDKKKHRVYFVTKPIKEGEATAALVNIEFKAD